MRSALPLLTVALVAGFGFTADPPAKPTAVPLDFVLLDGDSPVRLAVWAEVDGVPVSTLWADAFAKLFAYHDRNGDGSLDAKEAATLPSARAVRQAMGSGFTPPAGSAPELGELDRDKDGKVSLAELTSYYTTAGLGNVLVGVGRLPSSAELTQALIKHLDTDGDGTLSEKEWKAAADTLKKLDKNDDELVGAGELSAKVVCPGAAGAHLLTLPSTDSTSPELIAKLPLALLPTDPKNVDWTAELAKRNPKLKVADLTAWQEKAPAKEWVMKLSDKSPATDRFSVQGNSVRVEGWVTAGKMTEVMEATRKQLIAQLDAPIEGGGRRAPSGLKWLLPTADRDGDGKCDPKRLPRVLLAVASVGYPQSIAVPNRRGPDWFRAMDRNGDGDVSKREFTGTPEVFAEIDTDKDGLIDPTEAEKYKPKK